MSVTPYWGTPSNPAMNSFTQTSTSIVVSMTTAPPMVINTPCVNLSSPMQQHASLQEWSCPTGNQTQPAVRVSVQFEDDYDFVVKL